MSMTVNASDVRGTALLLNVTNAQTAYNAAVVGSADALQKNIALAAAQYAACEYFLTSGRLQPALVLASTL